MLDLRKKEVRSQEIIKNPRHEKLRKAQEDAMKSAPIDTSDSSVFAPVRAFINQNIAGEKFAEEIEPKDPRLDIPDPKLYLIFAKIQKLCTELGIVTREEQDKFLEENIISPGSFTIEWLLPSPPPTHTFEELPLVKQSVSESHHHH